MLLSFDILAFFWRQFYQEKKEENVSQKVTTTPSKSSKVKARSGNLDWSSSTTSPRLQGNQVWKFIRLIFIYYKSEVSVRSGPEIRSTNLHQL